MTWIDCLNKEGEKDLTESKGRVEKLGVLTPRPVDEEEKV
jgi:hypothetical protein